MPTTMVADFAALHEQAITNDDALRNRLDFLEQLDNAISEGLRKRR